MFAVFLLFFFSLPADRAPVYRGLSLPGPTGVPTENQGQSANHLAAATAETAATAACVCACDQHWTCFQKKK